MKNQATGKPEKTDLELTSRELYEGIKTGSHGPIAPMLLCQDEVVRELRAIRTKYDEMEVSERENSFDEWRSWKGVRNVITDRIEELTGDRV